MSLRWQFHVHGTRYMVAVSHAQPPRSETCKPAWPPRSRFRQFCTASCQLPAPTSHLSLATHTGTTLVGVCQHDPHARGLRPPCSVSLASGHPPPACRWPPTRAPRCVRPPRGRARRGAAPPTPGGSKVDGLRAWTTITCHGVPITTGRPTPGGYRVEGSSSHAAETWPGCDGSEAPGAMLRAPVSSGPERPWHHTPVTIARRLGVGTHLLPPLPPQAEGGVVCDQQPSSQAGHQAWDGLYGVALQGCAKQAGTRFKSCYVHPCTCVRRRGKGSGQGIPRRCRCGPVESNYQPSQRKRSIATARHVPPETVRESTNISAP